jgi:AraC-like DNA-binding protein
MYLIPASHPHSSYTETGFSQMAINFRTQEDERGFITMLKKNAKSISFWHQCQMLQAASELADMGDLLTLQDQLYAAQRLDAIVLSFMKEKDRSSVFQQQLRALLENHLAVTLSLQQIADRMSYSRAQVQRVTQQHLGCSVMEFYRRIRLQKACEWLLYSDLDVGWIAESLGFSDQSHFQSFFKGRMHMTPKQFRQTKRM